MFATVRIYRGAPTLADRLIEREKDVRGLLETVPGFNDYLLIRTPDGIVSVTTCKDRKGCEESTRKAREFLAQNVPNVSKSPEVLEGETIVRFGAGLAAVTMPEETGKATVR